MVSQKLLRAHMVSKVRFLHEQKGPYEELLTAKLSQELAALKQLVVRAYLVRISNTNDSRSGVVLAIRTRSGREEPGLLPVVGAAFSSLFGSHQHLDILFIQEDRERAIAEVCLAFYSADAERGP